MADLVVNVGIIEAAVSNNPTVPDEVKEALSEKIEQFCERVANEIVEFQMFAENFDRD